MRTRITATLIAILVLALAAPALASSHESDVTVVHGIPGATVDVWVDGEPFLEGFEPSTVTDPQPLPEGTYSIAVYAAGSDPESDDPVIAEDDYEVPGGANVSLVAHLTEDGTPALSAFANDVSELGDGDARLTARHAAAAPATDVRADGDVIIDGFTNGDEGTVEVPAGTYAADVTLAGEDEAVIGPADLDLAAGTHYIAYAIGSADEGDLDLIVQTIDGLGAGDDSGADDHPDEVPAGSGGLLDTGMPMWAMAALALGAALTLTAGTRLVRARA